MELKIDKQVRGTRIIYGDEAKKRRSVLNKMIQIVEEQGFNEIILPSIEKSEIYSDKAGKEILTQMYFFKDKGDRDLCLRPEVTATIQLLGGGNGGNLQSGAMDLINLVTAQTANKISLDMKEKK